MQKFYSKSKLWMLATILFLSMNFYSCNKPEKLHGTSWESDYFETEFEGDIYRIEKITIFFGEPDRYFNTSVDIKVYEAYHPIFNTTHDGVLSVFANYTFEGKNLTLKFVNTTEPSLEQDWVGTVDKKTMTLRNVLGKTVEFRKR